VAGTEKFISCPIRERLGGAQGSLLFWASPGIREPWSKEMTQNGFHKVSRAAAALEECIDDSGSGRDPSASIESDLAALVDCIERE
jgi:hypothetical protein